MSSSTQPQQYSASTSVTSNIRDLAAFSMVAELASRAPTTATYPAVKPDPDARIFVPVKREAGIATPQAAPTSSSSSLVSNSSTAIAGGTTTTSSNNSSDPKVQRFVQKLWNIVNAGSGLVGWNTVGNRIVVHRPKDFAKQILPRYFNTSNLSSFTRQLHFYGFKKTLGRKRSRQENWECEHEWFARDHPEWLTRITRKRCNVQLASQEETAELRTQLRTLQETVSQQQKQIESMASMMVALQRQQQRPQQDQQPQTCTDEHERLPADDFMFGTGDPPPLASMDDFVNGGFGLALEDLAGSKPAASANYWS